MVQARRISRDASHPPWGMLYYEPSLLFALNKGLVSLDESAGAACPEVFSFLRGDLTTFDPALMPDDIATKAPDATVNEHWYLFAILGVFWRFLGTTHDAAWMLQYAFLCIAAACIFGICRLSMGPILSLLAAYAFIMSPLTASVMSSSFRDFSRAPFFAAILWLLGMLVRYGCTRKQYLLITLVLGLIIGFGAGFRADMFVALPLSLPVLWSCRLKKPGVWVRLMGTTLLVGLFFLAGSGVHTRDSRSLFFNGWRATCGFAGPCEDAMQLRFGSYEKLSVFHDDYGLFAAQDSAALGATPVLARLREAFNTASGTERDDALVFIAYAWTMARHFPADMVMRIYGATRTILQGFGPGYSYPPFDGIAAWGPLFALLVVAALVRGNPRRALLLAWLLLAFCGYTSIQFHPRHGFHLMFLPYWAAGTAMSMGMLYIRHCIAAIRDCRSDGKAYTGMGSHARDAAFTGAGLLLIIALLWLPLAVTRPFQARQLRHLADTYQAAERASALAEVRDTAARTLFQAAPMADCAELLYEAPFAFQGATYMVRLENVDAYPDLWIEYAPGMYQWNAYNVPVTFYADATPTELCVYFRAYEGLQMWSSLWFVGVSLPREQAHFFKGLYRVDDAALDILPVVLALPDDVALLQPWLRFQRRGYRQTPFTKFMSPNDRASVRIDAETPLNPAFPRDMNALWARAGLAEQSGNHTQAREIRLALLDAFPDYPAVFRHLLYQVEFLGARPAWETLSELREARPEMRCLHQLIREWLREHLKRLFMEALSARETGDQEGLTALLNQILDIDSSLYDARLLLAEALIRQGRIAAGLAQMPEQASSRFLTPQLAALIYRDAYDSLSGKTEGCILHDLLERAIFHYRDAVNETPENLWHQVHMGEMLEQLGRGEEAVGIYQKVLYQAPESPYTAARVDALLAAQTPNDRLTFWRTLNQGHPDAVQPGLRLGVALYETGNHEEACRVLEALAARAPENNQVGFALGCVLLYADNMDRALRLLSESVAKDAALAYDAGRAVAARAQIAYEAADLEQAERLYRAAAAYAPDDLWHQVRLGETLEARHREEDAIEVYQRILDSAPESPYTADRLDALYNKRDRKQERLDFWRALRQRRPEAFLPFMKLGEALHESGGIEEALKVYNQALERRPGDNQTQLRVGWMNVLLGQEEQGFEQVMGAVMKDASLASTAARVYADAATRATDSGRHEDAVQLLQHAAALDVQDQYYRFRLAEACESAGRPEAALDAYLHVVRRTPDSPVSAARADAILVETADSEARIVAWRRLSEEAHTHALPLVYLGCALADSGDLIGAMQAYRVALERDPQLEAARVAIERLMSEMIP